MAIERIVPTIPIDGALRAVYTEVAGGGTERAGEFEFESCEELRGVAEDAEFEAGVQG